MKLLPPTLGLLALLTCSLMSAQTPSSTGDVTDITVVRTYQQHPGASLVWEPYITVWKPKWLVAAYGAGIPGKTDMGDLYDCVSTDDGATWSEPVCIFNHQDRQGTQQFAYANTILYHPPGQDIIWCYGMRCPMNYKNSEDGQMVGAWSADGGRSWNQAEMAMDYHGSLIVVAGIYRVMENGYPKYLIPAHSNTLRADPHGTRDQMVLESTSLMDWKLAGVVPQPTVGDKVFLHEGGIAEGDAPGELKMVMRTANWQESGALNPPRAFSSVSKDGGHTWSAAQQEPDLWNARSKAYFGKLADGSHLYVYSDGPAGSRHALRYKVQSPSGTWGQERTFYDAGTKNSYPTLVEGPHAGEFYAVWDSGTKDRARTMIHFGKFKPNMNP